MELSSSSVPFIPGDIVDGKYEVLEVLGAGGMGVVLAARHLTLDSEVAVKVLLPKFQKDPVIRERFLREARAAATLRSKHVARILDVGIDRLDAPYIVMERLRGKDLEKILAERGPIEPRVALEYIAQACEALAEAHTAGIVHRDLKPENLFVTGSGAATCLKVLDFGISKHSYEQKMLTATADVMGTPHFMSPEQFRSTRDVNARADVWALGAILYRVLTGVLPFDGNDYVELCSRIMTQAPAPMESLRPSLSPAICALVRRCLDKDQAQRFANAHELRDALRALLSQSKVNERLAMAATIPFDQMPAPVRLGPSIGSTSAPFASPSPSASPWPSKSVPPPAPRRRARGVIFGVGAALAALLVYGATHKAAVARYVHPAPIQAEAPAAVIAEPLEARASMLAIDSNVETPKAKVGRGHGKPKRAL